MENTVKVVYMGRREFYEDPLYGTGRWSRDGNPWPVDKIKRVPADVAAKMLRHHDVWHRLEDPVVEETLLSAGIELGKANISTKVDEQDADESQRVRDAISAMDTKQAIADFVAVNYGGVKLDKRVSLDAMKQEAIRMVDQYGVTP